MRRRLLLSLLAMLLLIAGFAAYVGLLWLERYYSDEYLQCTEIEPGLWMGGYVGEPPANTTAVLNLCELQDPYPCAVLLWEPIRDTAPAPDLDWLRRMVRFVAAERQRGGTVFVHCRAGVSRSGMVVVAYLMFEHGWTRDAALDFARSKRPLVRPNPAFMDRLHDWEKDLESKS